MAALAYSQPCSLVELSISCRNLINKDILSKSDPCCVVHLKDVVTNRWKEIARTETIMDNLNPEFAKKIRLTYLFEERQLLKFDVYDIDSASASLSDHDFLGGIEITLGEIVSSSGLKDFERPLIISGQRNTGVIKIQVEEIPSSKEHFTLQCVAQNLPTSFFGGSHKFFFEIHKAMESGAMALVHRSPVISGKKNVTWAAFQISSHTLCNCDVDKNLRFTLYQHKSSGSHKAFGICNATAKELLYGASSGKATFKLSSGAIFQVVSITKEGHSTFMEYVNIGGVQLNCFVAVDFTASNGHPSSPTSLHYINHHGFNQYQMALKAVLDIIQDYDSDKMFPALGFGAQLPPNWQVSHEFFLNFHPTNPYCEGVDGVMSAYCNSLYNVRLSGPTNFAPVINHVSRFATAHNDGQNYFILLIITDGVITDMAATVDAIVGTSFLPVSIIIVGVGSADFDAMEVLDADDKPLIDSRQCKMERDIVQFVPFSTILQRAGNNLAAAQLDLARFVGDALILLWASLIFIICAFMIYREVLAEIPTQFLSYMRKIGKTPQQLASLKS